jgi:hypothetical protein
MLAALALLDAPSAAIGAPEQGGSPARVTRTFSIPPDRPIVVEATVADVSIAAWTRAEIEVQVERRAEKGADLGRIEPRFEDGPDGLIISTRQADGPPDRALRASMAIRAPARANFKSVTVVDGRILLDGLRGSVAADLRQGSIEGVRLAGTIRLETGFGDVELRQTELVPDGLLRLRAFNGNVTLHLSAVPQNARILALSFNGAIASDIPLTMKDRFGPKFGEATLGSGEPVISLDAVYGDVVIRIAK